MLYSSCFHACGVRAGGTFGHREANPEVAVDQWDEISPLLIVGSVVDQCEHRRILGTHAVHCPRAEMREGSPDLDLDDRVGEMAQAHAAVFDGNERAPQPGVASLGLELLDD